MVEEKIHIYFVPGLAANPSIFDFIKLPKDTCELHYLEWLIPDNPKETIEEYAQRMCAKVIHENIVLIGVSFGGVMVQEMKKILNPKKTIIISSIKNKNEMPSRMHFVKKTSAHKIFPIKAFSNIEKYERYAFGDMLKGRIKLYKKYLSMRDELYLPWAIDTIVNWKQENSDPDILHIHGTKDFIFPIENIKECVKIDGGTHIMILTEAKKITTLLQEMILANTNKIMQIEKTTIKDIKVIAPKIYKDKRGYFMESYNHKLWSEHLETDFVQDNESMSEKGVLRGLHFQKPPYAQAKLVRVIKGSVLDVAVDLRKSSPTFGQHFKILLSAENKKQLFIPAGFAHGFLCLENGTVFAYKCSQYYNSKAEDIIAWNDPDLAIEWGIEQALVSERDAKAQKFSTFKTPF